MTIKTHERIHETSTSTGTGDISLDGAESFHEAFGDRLSDGDECRVMIAHQSLDEWERSICTYNATADSLTRDTVKKSTNGDAKVSFSAGTKDVFLDSPDAEIADMLENLTANQIIFVDSNGLHTQSDGFIFNDSAKRFTVGNGSSAVDPTIFIDGASSRNKNLVFREGGVGRFIFRVNTANNFTITAIADDGSNLGDVLEVVRLGSGKFHIQRQLTVTDGTFASPGLAFDSDQNTGLHRSAADTLEVVAGGAQMVQAGPDKIAFGRAHYSLKGSGTSGSLNWNSTDNHVLTLDGNKTVSFSNQSSGQFFILLVKQDATGSRTITWPTIRWPGGTAPTLTSTANKADMFRFYYDGTDTYGWVVAQNM